MRVKGIAAHSGVLDIGPTHLWVRPGWAACQRLPFRSPVDLGEMDDDKIDCKRCAKILEGQKFIMSQLPVMPHPISTKPTGDTFQDVPPPRKMEETMTSIEITHREMECINAYGPWPFEALVGEDGVEVSWPNHTIKDVKRRYSTMISPEGVSIHQRLLDLLRERSHG